jgi:hypothetical protein
MAENEPAETEDTASRSVEAGIADETAAYDKAMTPTEGGTAEDESEAQPS